MSIALSVENVSKQYRLGLVGSGTLRDDLIGWWYRMRGLEDPTLKIGEENDRTKTGDSNYGWALQDINFEVQQGEVLGVIGKNGAGKSTLLKLLSRVTSPTTGSIKAKGRIASLLEVGTGFHPELTGRENIFLNGAIMGMNRHEINRKLDEIVAFAGVERYLDTPVKRYSSGMYVRLAFAVAAHLEPEILIVDEVLAVGDADFQTKAIGKMKDVSSGEGRTVLFVSHNMASVNALCSSAILLKNGKVVQYANTYEVVASYLKSENISSVCRTLNPTSENFSLSKVHIHNQNRSAEEIYRDKPIEIDFSYSIKESITQKQIYINLRVKDTSGQVFMVTASKGASRLPQETGNHTVFVQIPEGFLNDGSYIIDLMIFAEQSSGKNNPLFREEEFMFFDILPEKRELGQWMGKVPGFVRPSFSWKTR